MIKIDESFLFDNLRKLYAMLSYCTPNNYMFPPIRYFLELTYRCNLNCPYCFINEKINPVTFKIIDELVENKFPSDHYGICAELELN